MFPRTLFPAQDVGSSLVFYSIYWTTSSRCWPLPQDVGSPPLPKLLPLHPLQDIEARPPQCKMLTPVSKMLPNPPQDVGLPYRRCYHSSPTCWTNPLIKMLTQPFQNVATSPHPHPLPSTPPRDTLSLTKMLIHPPHTQDVWSSPPQDITTSLSKVLDTPSSRYWAASPQDVDHPLLTRCPFSPQDVEPQFSICWTSLSKMLPTPKMLHPFSSRCFNEICGNKYQYYNFIKLCSKLVKSDN
jgi:hypothetical protein